jgi:hypothetical protein
MISLPLVLSTSSMICVATNVSTLGTTGPGAPKKKHSSLSTVPTNPRITTFPNTARISCAPILAARLFWNVSTIDSIACFCRLQSSAQLDERNVDQTYIAVLYILNLMNATSIKHTLPSYIFGLSPFPGVSGGRRLCSTRLYRGLSIFHYWTCALYFPAIRGTFSRPSARSRSPTTGTSIFKIFVFLMFFEYFMGGFLSWRNLLLKRCFPSLNPSNVLDSVPCASGVDRTGPGSLPCHAAFPDIWTRGE